MKNKKFSLIYTFMLSFLFISTFNVNVFAADPKLVTTINSAFDKIESYIVKISTPAAAVAVGTGVLMKKFSFGDEEKIRTANKLIRGSLLWIYSLYRFNIIFIPNIIILIF